MLPLTFGRGHRRLRILCLGAHPDDIEIGCAGTLLRWISAYPNVEITWAVLSAAGDRADEAQRSAGALLRRAARLDVVLGQFEDASFPAEFRRIKAYLQELKQRSDADVVLTHRLEDRHQDHRLLAELTWQNWRNHLILEYEIPKFEGDLGQPNLYVPLSKAIAERKVGHLLNCFGSQRSKSWFNAEAFFALMRLRGLECRAPSGMAEAFHLRKGTL